MKCIEAEHAIPDYANINTLLLESLPDASCQLTPLLNPLAGHTRTMQQLNPTSMHLHNCTHAISQRSTCEHQWSDLHPQPAHGHRLVHIVSGSRIPKLHVKEFPVLRD